MRLSLSIGPLISLIAGILILIMPRLLNYIVAIYLIVMGLIGLFGLGAMRLSGSKHCAGCWTAARLHEALIRCGS